MSTTTNTSKAPVGSGRGFRKTVRLAARGFAARVPRCSRRSYLATLAGCPFESHPTAQQPHLTPPQPRQTDAGGKPLRRRPLPPSRSGSRPLGARRARHRNLAVSFISEALPVSASYNVTVTPAAASYESNAFWSAVATLRAFSATGSGVLPAATEASRMSSSTRSTVPSACFTTSTCRST